MKDMSTKWFHFKDGSNPYGVWNQNEFFRMIVSWNVVMEDNDSFTCYEPTEAYYGPVGYQFKKEALRNFAIEYQNRFSEIVSSWYDCSFWSNFFEKYGRKYGLLNEFHENGIC